MTHSLFYRWADQLIAVVCADMAQVAQLDIVWRELFSMTPVTAPVDAPTLVLHYGTSASNIVRPPLLTRLAHDVHSTMWRTPAGYCLQVGASWLAIGNVQGQVRGVIELAFWQLPLTVQREFFQRSLLLLLSQQQRYGLHANGVIGTTGGLLLIGPSGSGKTTLTLSLVISGWRYLGDDVVLLQQGAAGVVAHTLQLGFACTQQTLAVFPQLRSAVCRELDPVRCKQQVNLAAVVPGQRADMALPHALLFPCIHTCATTELTPLTPAESLFLLVEQSAGLLVDRASAAQQLTVLRNLVQQAPGYRIRLGRDLVQEPAIATTLLNEL